MVSFGAGCASEELESRRLLSVFSQMIVFGDSLSDTGNVPSLLASAAGYTESNGRFTSDPTSSPPSSSTGVWHEELASQLGIPVATAASSGGQNWATGGAETGQGSESGEASVRRRTELSLRLSECWPANQRLLGPAEGLSQ